MSMTASLPMYNAPGMRAANTALWTALRELLREAGLDSAPEGLSFDRRRAAARDSNSRRS